MSKKYTTPEMEITQFEAEDVIQTSCDIFDASADDDGF